MQIYNDISELIGNTKLLQLNKIMKNYNLNANIIAKLECLNPAGSSKDRIAKEMLLNAKSSGVLKPDTVVIEPTSGNTGIGLAAMCAYLGNPLILVMPDTMSKERMDLLKAYGAQLVLTSGKNGMAGAIQKAKELCQNTKNSYMPLQFENPCNPNAHYLTTGPEIWRDTDGKIDVFVAGVGTGGTISGTAKYLKQQNKNLHVVAVEPTNSAVLSKKSAGPHKIQGIGAGFVPNTLDENCYDEIVCVTDEQAYETCKELVRTEGILTGISSGCALFAAIQIAQKPQFFGKNIVVLLPDTGERYLSTGVFFE